MAKQQQKLPGMKIFSMLIDRMALATRLGKSFGGKRDTYEVFGYNKKPLLEDYILRYYRQDIARRIVDAAPKATWAAPPTIEFPTNKGMQKTFVPKWEAFTRQHNIWASFSKADRLAGLGNFSVLLMGFDDGADMTKAVTKGSKLIYLTAFLQLSVTIIGIESDTSHERFGMPTMYRIRAKDPYQNIITAIGSTLNIPQVDVHWTRILHVAEDAFDNGIVGTPRLQAVYNRLDDLEKVVGGSAETFWLTANRGMQVDVDKEAEMDDEDQKALSDEIDEYQHQLRRVIRTRGVKVTTLGSDIPDPISTFKTLIAMIASSTGIPQMVLIGAEQGHLASDQDRANWADRIKERRNIFIEPLVLKPFIQRLIDNEELPQADLSLMSFSWQDTYQLTPLEEAQTYAQRARAAVNLSAQFGNKPIMTKSEARGIIGLPIELPNEIPEVTIADSTIPDPNAATPPQPTKGKKKGKADAVNPTDATNPANDSSAAA